MNPASIPGLWLLAVAAAAQAPRLVDSIESPFAYVSLDGPGGGDGSGLAHGALGPVHRLLADPALHALLNPDRDGGSPTPAEGGGGASRALGLMRGMLARGAADIELALTGITGSGGQPLLILRARLQADAAERLAVALAEAKLASSHRQVGGQQTYRLRREPSPAEGGGAENDGPGDLVELALVGDDLVIGNDGSAMHEVLSARTAGTATSESKRVLSADPHFQTLRQRLEMPHGSLLVYGDWQRLGRRLRGQLDGVPGRLLDGSGIGSARSIMMSIAPANADFSATLLLEFESGDTEHRELPSGKLVPTRGIDGWLAAAQSVSARTLLRELPRGGLGGLVLSVDLAEVAGRSPRNAHMVWDLREAYSRFGLDFDRNLLGRLGGRGTVQLHFESAPLDEPTAATAGGGGLAVVKPVYALRATSRRAASDLFEDLRRVVESQGLGRLVAGKEARGKRQPDVLELRGTAHAFAAYVAVAEDTVILGEDLPSVALAHEEARGVARARGPKDALAGRAIQVIGGESVAGLFDLDFTPLLNELAKALPGVDLSALPRRHIGYLDIDGARADRATVVRICVLSSR